LLQNVKQRQAGHQRRLRRLAPDLEVQHREPSPRWMVALPPAEERRHQPDLTRLEMNRRRRPLPLDVRQMLEERTGFDGVRIAPHVWPARIGRRAHHIAVLPFARELHPWTRHDPAAQDIRRVPPRDCHVILRRWCRDLGGTYPLWFRFPMAMLFLSFSALA